MVQPCQPIVPIPTCRSVHTPHGPCGVGAQLGGLAPEFSPRHAKPGPALGSVDCPVSTTANLRLVPDTASSGPQPNPGRRLIRAARIPDTATCQTLPHAGHCDMSDTACSQALVDPGLRQDSMPVHLRMQCPRSTGDSGMDSATPPCHACRLAAGRKATRGRHQAVGIKRKAPNGRPPRGPPPSWLQLCWPHTSRPRAPGSNRGDRRGDIHAAEAAWMGRASPRPA